MILFWTLIAIDALVLIETARMEITFRRRWKAWH